MTRTKRSEKIES